MSAPLSSLLRRSATGLGLATSIVTVPLAAQVRWSARLGATYSTPIVSDQVVSPVTISPGVAPVLLLGGSIPMDRRGRRFGIEVALASGGYAAKENGVSTHLGTLRTATVTVDAEGEMRPGLWWRAGIGFISYLPAERSGIFQDGAPTRVAGEAGLEYRRVWRPGWEISGVLRWDYHRFTTPHLQSLGYTGGEDVHRITLAVGVVH